MAGRSCSRCCLLAAVVLLAACSHQATVGTDATRIVFGAPDRWAVIVLTVACLAGAARLLRRPGRWLAGSILAFLAVVGMLAAASLLTARVILTAEGVHQRTGFPWATRTDGFRFDEVRDVRLSERRVRLTRSNAVERVWSLGRADGSRRELVVGGLWRRAEVHVLEHVARHGVVVLPQEAAPGGR